MSSLARNNRRTKPAKGDGDDVIDMKSLKESLNLILQDAERKEQRRRHKCLSSGAQKIMDRLASLRSDDINPPEARYNKPRRRRPKKQQISDEEEDDDTKLNNDHHLPRLIHSSSLDTSSYSLLFGSSSTTLDASFANTSLDDSFGRSQSRGLNETTSSCCINNEHEEKKQGAIIRRKSIPRHRNLEMNSSISSCLRPAKYTTNGSSGSSIRSSSALTSQSQRSFNSSSLSFDMEDFRQNSWHSNSGDSSWVASGVVIAESMEVIHMK